MMYDLPDPDTLYQALLDRDPSYEGRAYVGVTSTGIFCRLTCPARKPLLKNCVFLTSPAACLQAGFRACLR
jgi:AraC family transcriptional regulator, regulatory protein of adaptative response / methylated-DNA-[protein]-cysteine methyltransferase